MFSGQLPYRRFNFGMLVEQDKIILCESLRKVMNKITISDFTTYIITPWRRAS